MKKKVLITILIIVLIVIGIFAYLFISDMQQEEKLQAEITEIEDLTNAENIDETAIKERLERTVTKGDYATVEQSYKSYIKDILENLTQISEILNSEKITNILTIENYQKDGKEFKETKNYINTTRQKLEEYKTKHEEFFTDEKAMSYINDKGLDSYYVDLYKQDMIGDLEEQYNEVSLESSLNELIKILDDSEKVIDLLSQNQNDWKIEGDTIVFYSENVSNEYDKLTNEIKEE